jgi:capsule polysaccharide export protein KpsE/RkpR
MKNETTTDLILQIETTSNLLAQLEAELVDIPNRRAFAVDNADSAALISLSHRTHDLPVEIRMSKIRLERLRVQRKEETLPEMEAEIERLFEPIEPAEKAYNEADKALKTARYAHSDAIQRRADIRQEVSELKAGITRLMHEKTAS